MTIHHQQQSIETRDNISERQHLGYIDTWTCKL